MSICGCIQHACYLQVSRLQDLQLVELDADCAQVCAVGLPFRFILQGSHGGSCAWQVDLEIACNLRTSPLKLQIDGLNRFAGNLGRSEMYGAVASRSQLRAARNRVDRNVPGDWRAYSCGFGQLRRAHL